MSNNLADWRTGFFKGSRQPIPIGPSVDNSEPFSFFHPVDRPFCCSPRCRATWNSRVQRTLRRAHPCSISRPLFSPFLIWWTRRSVHVAFPPERISCASPLIEPDSPSEAIFFRHEYFFSIESMDPRGTASFATYLPWIDRFFPPFPRTPFP